MTSGFVAALALAASVYNVYLQRKQIQAQVWPNLEWSYSSSSSEGTFSFNLESTGVGPARIRGTRLMVDGQPVATWDEALEALVKTDPKLEALMKQPRSGGGKSTIGHRVIAPGVKIHPIEIGFAVDAGQTVDLTALVRAFDRVSVRICYCSTLDECQMHGEPVAKCDPAFLTFED